MAFIDIETREGQFRVIGERHDHGFPISQFPANPKAILKEGMNYETVNNLGAFVTRDPNAYVSGLSTLTARYIKFKDQNESTKIGLAEPALDPMVWETLRTNPLQTPHSLTVGSGEAAVRTLFDLVSSDVDIPFQSSFFQEVNEAAELVLQSMDPIRGTLRNLLMAQTCISLAIAYVGIGSRHPLITIIAGGSHITGIANALVLSEAERVQMIARNPKILEDYPLDTLADRTLIQPYQDGTGGDFIAYRDKVLYKVARDLKRKPPKNIRLARGLSAYIR